MKEIIQKYEHSITAGSIKRLILALFSTIFVSSTITQWTVQALEPLPHWGEYALYSTLFLCLALPGLYLFELRPLTFLTGQLAQAERAVLITSECLSNLISSSSVILFSMRVVGDQLHPEWVNYDDLYRLLGYSEEEVMQPDWWLRYLHPQDRASVLATTAKLFEGESVACDYRFMHKNGSEVWIHDEQKLVHYEHDKPTHVLCMWYDITRQKMVERELSIATHMFDSQEGVIVTDADMVIQRVNTAFTRITGYSAEETVGKIPEILNSGRQDALFYRAMRQSIQRDGYWQGEIWNRRKNGEIYPEWLTITAIKDGEGNITHHVGTLYDITDRNGAEERIRILAFYDPLTKLPNRRLLQDRIDQAIAVSARSRQHGALLFLDLDRFKILNDTYGHNMGDQLLLEVSRRLQACVREDDTIARLGGDEFVMILNTLDKYATKASVQAKKLAEMIREALAKPYHLLVPFNQSQATITYHSSASIGVVLFLGHESSTEELMKYADLAMYEAKHAGRDTVCIFDPGMQTDIMARASLEEDLHHGLQEKQFVLHYQPQVDREGRLIGSEALVRWQHPLRGMVSPADFIPLAEESGLILPLGIWVLETACIQLAIWAAHPETADLTLAVNVSAKQFRQADFVDQVLAVLERTGADPFKLKLELTESLLVSNVEDIIVKMATLKAKGVSFSLDDFGTGYSSLTYLKRLPLDQLKIDQSFVRDILIDLNDAAIAKMIVALAESMGLSVIAEGVENDAQRGFLAHQGCYAYQGYLFSHPLPVEQFEAYVKARSRQQQGAEFDVYSASAADSSRSLYQAGTVV
ncbi:MAG: EAL domain-containing protein [Methylococcaceae bacterium]